MTPARTGEKVATQPPPPRAVAWIDRHEAIVAAIGDNGRIRTFEISRGWLGEDAYLARIVDAIGDQERVMILGRSPIRVALEQAYVGRFERPDRLVDVVRAGRLSREDVVDRIRLLGA